jgi:Zn-dependent peptidase ImmA (M78 family)
MTLFTSGDWIVDNEREITFGVFEFMCKKFPLLVGATVEVNQVDLTNEFGCGFCQVDEDGEFLIHIHNDLSCEEYVTTLIHELVHVKQTLQGLKDHEMRESEAYFWERLLSREYMTSSISGTQSAEIPA